MIVSRPCRTQVSSEPVMPPNSTGLWTFVLMIFNDSYHVGIDVVYSPSFQQGLKPHPVKGHLDMYEDMIDILLMLHVFLAEDPEIKWAPSWENLFLP